MNIVESEKNSLSEDYTRLRTADSWSRRSPSKAPPGMGDPIMSHMSSGMRGKSSAATSTYLSQEKKLVQKKVEHERLIRDLRKQVTTMNKENEGLKQALSKTAETTSNTNEKANTITTKNSALEGLAMRQKAKNRALEKELASVKQAYTSASQEISRQKAALTKAQNTARSARTASRQAAGAADSEDKVRQEHEAAELRAKSLQLSVAEGEAVISRLKTDLKDHKKEIKQLKDENDDLVNKSSGGGASSEELKLMQIEHLRLQQQCARLRAGRDSDSADIKSFSAKLVSETTGLQTKIDALQQQNEDLAGAASDASGSTAELQEKLENLAEEKDEIAKAKARAELHVAELEAAQSELEAKVSDMSVASLSGDQQSQDILAAKENELIVMSGKLRGLKTELQSMEQQLAIAKTMNAELMSDQDVQSTKLKSGAKQYEEALAVERGIVDSLKSEILMLEAKADVAHEARTSAAANELSSVANELAASAAASEAAADAARQESADALVAVQAEADAAEAAAQADAAKQVDAKKKAADEMALARERNRQRKEAERKVREEKEAADKAEADKKHAESLAKMNKAQAMEAKMAAEELARQEAHRAKEAAAMAEIKAAREATKREQEAAADAEAARVESERKALAQQEAADAAARHARAEQRKQEEAVAAVAAKSAAEAEEMARLKAQEHRLKEQAAAARAAAEAEAAQGAAAQAAAEAEAAAARAAAQADAEAAEAKAATADAADGGGDDVFSLTPRYFNTLYDYDPQDASPNDDDVDEELTLTAGQIVKIFGDPDEDGFYSGQLTQGPHAGKKGVVPSNFVEELSPEDVASIVGEPAAPVAAASGGDEVRRRFIVLYDYDPVEHSPNEDPDDELSLREGQVVTVIGDVGDDGFFLAEDTDGLQGHIPSNFVEEDEAFANDHDAEGQELPIELPVFAIDSYVRALYDYHPDDLSPNDETEEELKFAEGDKMKIMKEMDDDGFYHAEHIATGNIGLVPSNFIEAYTDGDDAVPTGGGYQSLGSMMGN